MCKAQLICLTVNRRNASMFFHIKDFPQFDPAHPLKEQTPKVMHSYNICLGEAGSNWVTYFNKKGHKLQFASLNGAQSHFREIMLNKLQQKSHIIRKSTL